MATVEIRAPYFATGGVAIYCGDCRDVLRALRSESVDMVLTDPPYGVDYRGRWCSDWEAIAGDEAPGVMLPAFAEIWRLLKPNSFCLSFYAWPHADEFLSAWKLIGFRPVSHLVCVKNNIGLGYFSRSQHETAYLLAKGHPARPVVATGDVFTWDREPVTYHPTQKPLQVISRLLSTFTREDALVLDPFMGSGTTLVAARNLGRRAIGIEIDERYCEIAVQRLAQQVFDFQPESSLPRDETLSLFPHEEPGLEDLSSGQRA
jgi:DNA modification methylase